jgi:phage-related protein
LKPLNFVGTSLEALRGFPRVPRREAGYPIDRVQNGLEPGDWKPIKTVGAGVREIRINHEGQFRVIYVTRINDTVYVLHAFQKKTRQTRKQDIEIAKQRLKQVRRNYDG